MDQRRELHTRKSFGRGVAVPELERRVQTDWIARRRKGWVRHTLVVVVVAELALALEEVGPNYCRAEWVERRPPIDCPVDEWRVRLPIRFQQVQLQGLRCCVRG